MCVYMVRLSYIRCAGVCVIASGASDGWGGMGCPGCGVPALRVIAICVGGDIVRGVGSVGGPVFEGVIVSSDRDRVVDSVRMSMPRVWALDPEMCAEFATGVGGNSVALVRVVHPVTGAHLVLSEDDRVYCHVFADDGERCEGHELSSSADGRNAVWWFRHGTVPSGPCSCMRGFAR